MSGLEERERAVELYFTTPMTTAQVVEHLGYPTRQCLERWLAMDSRYAGHMAKPIIPLETRRRAVELVLGGMQQKQAAKQLGAGVGAVHGWVRCVCSIESGPCERVDVFHVSGRFWSTSACGEKRTPARPAWTSFPS